MKRLFLLITVAILSIPVMAQRNLPRQLSLELSSGMVDGVVFRNNQGLNRYFMTLSLNRMNRNRTFWNFGIGYMQKDYLYQKQVISKAQITVETGYNIMVLSDRRSNVNLSVGASALAGYEMSN